MMGTPRIALALTTAAALASMFVGCTVAVKDEGKWGDLAEGGDVTKLHDAGTFCASWSPSNYSPAPACKNEEVCTQWAKKAFPPGYVSDGNMCNSDGTGLGPHCELYEFSPHMPKCNPGQAGDAYCQAYYAAWMQPGVRVNAQCFANGSCGPELGDSCAYCVLDCGSGGIANDHFGLSANTCPGPEWLSMCVVEHDGSIGCQELCADAPSGVPQRP